MHLFAPLERIARLSTVDDTIRTTLLKYERLLILWSCWTQVPPGDLEVKDIVYGPWLRGVDNIRSYQLLVIYDLQRY